MKAIVVHQPGPPEVLCYEEIPTPAVRSGWSLVKVQASRRQPVGNIHTSGAFPHRYLPANIGN